MPSNRELRQSSTQLLLGAWMRVIRVCFNRKDETGMEWRGKGLFNTLSCKVLSAFMLLKAAFLAWVEMRTGHEKFN